MQQLEVVILAAGAGKRMHSRLPKVLHPLAGKSMIDRVLDAARSLNPSRIHIIHGHESERLKEHLQHDVSINWVYQAERLGTGHAVQQAMPFIEAESHVLILCADVPLISSDTLRQMTLEINAKPLMLLTATVANPFGLGRIIKNNRQEIIGIIEEKDASSAQRAIHDIYSGILLATASFLKANLGKLSNANVQAEFYLTELITIAASQNLAVGGLQAASEQEIQGVNSRAQLINLERYYQAQRAQDLLAQGVTILDPQRFDVRGELTCGQDVTIDINNLFLERNQLGNGCSIGPNCVLRNVTLGDDVVIEANSVIEDAEIGNACKIGPFARIRPGTHLKNNVRIGNFVEVKKSVIAADSKVNHLSYIGDAIIGERVNVGAGTITCNYDGANKHQTIIKNDAFIGSDTQLVAPVTIGENATIGAGSTICTDAPPQQLTLSRSPQKSISRWQRPAKSKD